MNPWEVRYDFDALGGEIKPIDRLAATLFVNTENPGTRLMALFAAYFDASGNGVDQPFVVVSGYISSVYQWRLFEGAWSSVHEEFGVNKPFHMADFMSARTNPRYELQTKFRQDYVDLAKNPKTADEFMKRICICQVGMVNCAISCILPMEIYTGVSTLLDLREVVPPYALAARMCIAKVHEWEQYFHIEETVECIFEEGDFEQGKFTELMVTEGMGVPIYKKKSDYAGLQAADHYAWEQFSFLRKELLGTHRHVRGELGLLLQAIPKLHVQPTTATLINLCGAKGINPATGVKDGKRIRKV